MNINSDYLKQRLTDYHTESAEYREYREQNWKDNHRLYYAKQDTNDTTQRQGVSTTLVKTTINTILSNLSDSPDIYFNEIDAKVKDFKGKKALDNKNELQINSVWEEWSKKNSIKLKDTAGKKNACLYGRDIKGLDIENGEIILRVVSPFNFLISRSSSVYDDQEDTYVARTHIAKTMSQIYADPRYDKEVVRDIADFLVTKNSDDEAVGGSNVKENPIRPDNLVEEEMRSDIGDLFAYNPWLGEASIELQEEFIKLVGPDEVKSTAEYLRGKGMEDHAKTIEKDKFAWYKVVRHNQKYFLYIEPVISYFNLNFNPYASWAYDVEDGKYWSFGVADDIRPSAIISNTLMSQMLENRALSNYGMHWFNTEYDDFDPGAYDPAPGAYLPVPGNPDEIMKPVEIQGIDENLSMIQYLDIGAQRASSATSLAQGVKTPGEQTLGEIQLLNENAAGRITPMRKFYTIHWEAIARMWVDILLANKDELNVFKTAKKGPDGIYHSTTIDPANISGDFKISVTTVSDKKQKDIELIQLFEYLSSKFPVPSAQVVIAEKLIGLVDGLDSETKKQIMDEIRAKGEMGEAPENAGGITAPITGGDNAGIGSALNPQAGGQQ